MKPFTIAFPLPALPNAAPEFLRETLNVDLSKPQILFPGTSFFCTPTVQGKVPDLEKIFDEHERLSAEEAAAIQGHRSIFFLQFAVKGFADFEAFLSVSKKILAAGSVGVYVENSGCAFGRKAFEEILGGDAPMEAFVNFVESSESLFTLGLEPFGLPDFCLKLGTSQTVDSAREVLLSAASSFFESGEKCSSGDTWETDSGTFEIREEFKTPYPKGSAEWNSLGYRRFLPRTRLSST